MSKISLSSERAEIEKIILECKFLGLGSVEIQRQLLSRLGFKASRPSIDKHYKQTLHGERLTKLIAETKKNAVLSVQNGESGQTMQPPSYCSESAKNAIDHIEGYIQDNWCQEKDNSSCQVLQGVYADTIGLVRGNVIAHLEGKERLKTEYLKYLKEIRDLIKQTKSSY